MLMQNTTINIIRGSKSMAMLHVTLWTMFISQTTAQFFQDAPGMVKQHIDSSPKLEWTLKADLAVIDEFKIFKGIRTNFLDADYLVYLQALTSCDPKEPRAACLYDSAQPRIIGFSLANIVETDADNYTCFFSSFGSGTEPNSAALMYIYLEPTEPTIEGNSPVIADNSVTITASASAQSLPLQYSQDAVLEYTWTIETQTSTGNTITIGPLAKSDDNTTVSCSVNEQGSNLTSQTDIQITVIWPSESAILTAKNTTVTEKEDDLVLTCTIQAGSEGKPDIYTYAWENMNVIDVIIDTPGNILTIEKDELSAKTHTGTWQCFPVNDAGRGSPGSLAITVTGGDSATTFNPPEETTPSTETDSGSTGEPPGGGLSNGAIAGIAVGCTAGAAAIATAIAVPVTRRRKHH